MVASEIRLLQIKYRSNIALFNNILKLVSILCQNERLWDER